MDIFEAMEKRRSVRKYIKGAEIPRETLLKIVQSGLNAPSARSVHPVKCAVITKKQGLEKLSAIIGNNGRFVADASAAFVVVSDDTKYYLEDGCAAVENMLLACHALGFGACWIAGDKKDYCGNVLDFVKAPEGSRLVAVISAGVPAESPVKEKPKAEKAAFFETF